MPRCLIFHIPKTREQESITMSCSYGVRCKLIIHHCVSPTMLLSTLILGNSETPFFKVTTCFIKIYIRRGLKAHESCATLVCQLLKGHWQLTREHVHDVLCYYMTLFNGPSPPSVAVNILCHLVSQESNALSSPAKNKSCAQTLKKYFQFDTVKN